MYTEIQGFEGLRVLCLFSQYCGHPMILCFFLVVTILDTLILYSIFKIVEIFSLIRGSM